MRALKIDRKESESQEKVDRFIEYQHSMTVLLGALYQAVQRSQAQNTPGVFIPHWVNVVSSYQIAPANSMRKKVTIINYGPSDVFISNEDMRDPLGVVSAYAGASNISLNVAVLKVSDPPLEISTSSAIYALPTLFGQSNGNSELSIYEELFTTPNSPLDSNGSAGVFWTGNKVHVDDDGIWHLIRELI